jgi:hypothetical protein
MFGAARVANEGRGRAEKMSSSFIRAEESRGPTARFPRSLLELVQRANTQTKVRAAFFLAAAWLPAAVLSAIHGLTPLRSFLTDFGVESRFLIVIPLLVLAEPPLRARLEFVARHFSEERLILEGEKGRFDAALSTSERLRDSTIARILIAISVFLCTLWLIPVVPVSTLMPWAVAEGRWYHLSAAGTWSALVSYPILLYLVLLWCWRQLLWTWFLHFVCRLQLRLVAAHPDHCGGLAFLRNSLTGQFPFSFALGTIAAGGVANRIIYHGQPPLEFKPVLVALVLFVVVFCTGPLCVFLGVLIRLKRQGAVAYGALASALGQQFETRWLRSAEERTPEILEVQDFSATTDLYSVVANVHALRPLPISVQDLAGIVIAALVPALPVALVVFPLDVILKEIIKLAF